MDWIPACRLIDPDHDEPAPCRRSADHLEGIAVLQETSIRRLSSRTSAISSS